MPLEGHWERQHTPLRLVGRRDRRTFALLACVLVIAAGAVLYAALSHGGASKPAAGCIRATAATSMGGGTVDACGAAARRLCAAEYANDTPLANALRPECRRAGYAPRGVPAGG
jgi:hypothetical protein